MPATVLVEKVSVQTGEAFPTFKCCGVRIDALQPAEAVSALLDSHAGVPRSVHLCNAYTLSLAVRDDAFRALLDRGDLNLADGTPVARYGRSHGHPHMVRRVYGPSLFEQTLDLGRRTGLRHFLYGSTPDVMTRLIAEINRRFPGAVVVGAESAPFRALTAEEGAALGQRVRSAQADIVWVGLGTPKQDEFVDRYADDLAATLVAVGAAFDFVARTKRQAPRWIQDRGLEWLYRLLTEPRRLWRRYLIGNTLFLWGRAKSRRQLAAEYDFGDV